jgi:hypothetical protein
MVSLIRRLSCHLTASPLSDNRFALVGPRFALVGPRFALVGHPLRSRRTPLRSRRTPLRSRRIAAALIGYRFTLIGPPLRSHRTPASLSSDPRFALVGHPLACQFSLSPVSVARADPLVCRLRSSSRVTLTVAVTPDHVRAAAVRTIQDTPARRDPMRNPT